MMLHLGKQSASTAKLQQDAMDPQLMMYECCSNIAENISIHVKCCIRYTEADEAD